MCSSSARTRREALSPGRSMTWTVSTYTFSRRGSCSASPISARWKFSAVTTSGSISAPGTNFGDPGVRFAMVFSRIVRPGTTTSTSRSPCCAA